MLSTSKHHNSSYSLPIFLFFILILLMQSIYGAEAAVARMRGQLEQEKGVLRALHDQEIQSIRLQYQQQEQEISNIVGGPAEIPALERIRRQRELLASINESLADIPGDNPLQKLAALKQTVQTTRDELTGTREHLDIVSALLQQEDNENRDLKASLAVSDQEKVNLATLQSESDLERNRLRDSLLASEQENRKLRSSLRDSEEIVKTICTIADSSNMNPINPALLSALERLAASLRDATNALILPAAPA